MSTLIDDATTDHLLRNLVIPPRPGVLDKIAALRRQPDLELGEIAEVLTEDLALTAAMLKAANSPLIGQGRKIASVPQALSLLGVNNTLNLLNGLAVRAALTAQMPPTLEVFWERAMTIASVAGALCEQLEGVPDEAQSFALFHGCGVAIMLMQMPDYVRTQRLIALARDGQIPKIEVQLHNTSNNVVGYLVARTWLMPEAFAQAILQQYNLGLFRGEEGLDASGKLMIAITRAARNVWRTLTDSKGDPGWEEAGPLVLGYLGLNDCEFEDWRDEMHQRIHEGG